MKFILITILMFFSTKNEENEIFVKDKKIVKYTIKNFYSQKAVFPLQQNFNKNIVKIDKTKEFKQEIECKFQKTGFFYKKVEDLIELQAQQKYLGYDDQKGMFLYADKNLHGQQIKKQKNISAFHFQKSINFNINDEQVFYQRYLGQTKNDGFINLLIFDKTMMLMNITSGESLIEIKAQFDADYKNQFFVLSETRLKNVHYIFIYESNKQILYIYNIDLQNQEFREFQILEMQKLFKNYGINKKTKQTIFGQYFEEREQFVLYVCVQKNAIFSFYKGKEDQQFKMNENNVQFLEADVILDGVNRFFFIQFDKKKTLVDIVRLCKYTEKLLIEKTIKLDFIPIDIYSIQNYIIVKTENQLYTIDIKEIEKLDQDVVLQDFYQIKTQIKAINIDHVVDQILDIQDNFIYAKFETQNKNIIIQKFEKQFQFIEANCDKRNQKNFQVKTYLDIYLNDNESNQKMLVQMQTELKKKTMTFWDIITDFLITIILIISILIGLFFCMFLVNPKRNSKFYNTDFAQSIQLIFKQKLTFIFQMDQREEGQDDTNIFYQEVDKRFLFKSFSGVFDNIHFAENNKKGFFKRKMQQKQRRRIKNMRRQLIDNLKNCIQTFNESYQDLQEVSAKLFQKQIKNVSKIAKKLLKILFLFKIKDFVNQKAYHINQYKNCPLELHKYNQTQSLFLCDNFFDSRVQHMTRSLIKDKRKFLDMLDQQLQRQNNQYFEYYQIWKV